MSRDPLGYVDSKNLFVYSRSMPTVASDPTGLSCGPGTVGCIPESGKCACASVFEDLKRRAERAADMAARRGMPPGIANGLQKMSDALDRTWLSCGDCGRESTESAYPDCAQTQPNVVITGTRYFIKICYGMKVAGYRHVFGMGPKWVFYRRLPIPGGPCEPCCPKETCKTVLGHELGHIACYEIHGLGSSACQNHSGPGGFHGLTDCGMQIIDCIAAPTHRGCKAAAKCIKGYQ